MNQLVVVNKPAHFTSRDVVNKLNKILNDKKIGHTGTLDPLATGVLVCLEGKYTKLVDLITAYDKEYIAKIKVGIKTDTGDITGNIIDTKESDLSLLKIQEVFNSFPKEYEQTVPKYSAIKIKGKKLYEYARAGEEITLPTRQVKIYELELLSYEQDIIAFRAKVSKGTYIRSLIVDLCNRLNVLGTMDDLVRTKQGNFTILDAYNLEDIESGNYKGKTIQEFLDYPVIEIPKKYLKIIKNGGVIDDIFKIEDKVIFTYAGSDIAIYEKRNETLKPFIMF